jgi:hypothetical protein
MFTVTTLAVMLGIALAMCGVAMIVGRNPLKSVVGVLVGYAGIAAVLTYLGQSAVLAAVCAASLVYAMLGAAIAVRLFEEYGTLETAALDAADQAADAARP